MSRFELLDFLIKERLDDIRSRDKTIIMNDALEAWSKLRNKLGITKIDKTQDTEVAIQYTERGRPKRGQKHNGL